MSSPGGLHCEVGDVPSVRGTDQPGGAVTDWGVGQECHRQPGGVVALKISGCLDSQFHADRMRKDTVLGGGRRELAGATRHAGFASEAPAARPPPTHCPPAAHPLPARRPLTAHPLPTLSPPAAHLLPTCSSDSALTAARFPSLSSQSRGPPPLILAAASCRQIAGTCLPAPQAEPPALPAQSGLTPSSW